MPTIDTTAAAPMLKCKYGRGVKTLGRRANDGLGPPDGTGPRTGNRPRSLKEHKRIVKTKRNAV